MALSRSFLRGLSLNEEQISAVIEAHAETVDALKAQQNELNGKLEAATKDLEAIKKNGWEEKYNQLSKEFEGFKADIAARDTKAAKERAYTDLLKEAGISDKRMSTIIKYDAERIAALELDDKGAVKGAKDLLKTISADWADFVSKPGVQGAQVQTPPAGASGSVTKEQFDKMGYRQRLELYNTNPDAYNALSGK